MTTAPLSFVPAPRVAEDLPPAPAPVHAVTADEMVVVPRHVADAAYHVLQAMHALKDDGAQQLFSALGKALNRGKDRPQIEYAVPCEVCHVEVGQGFAHHVECWSDEAARYRSLPVPQIDPYD
jgi:hypothetical protein